MTTPTPLPAHWERGTGGVTDAAKALRQCGLVGWWTVNFPNFLGIRMNNNGW
jgi:hypothetical protein